MRSLTAESLYDGFPGYEVKSAGTDSSARTRLTREHIQWADMIFVMEQEHLEFLKDHFANSLHGKPLICLNIPDIYCFCEPALVHALKARLREYVQVPS